VTSGLLLDTCAAIFIVEDQPIRPEARAALYAAGDGGGIFVSPVSGWEIGLLARRGRMAFAPDAKAWFARLLALRAIHIAPFTHDIAIDCSALPEPLHADPADRFLVATARSMSVPIMTRDRKLIAYGETDHLQVIAC
jgi:PIN domain nuclease of toxin-antitoxin system